LEGLPCGQRSNSNCSPGSSQSSESAVRPRCGLYLPVIAQFGQTSVGVIDLEMILWPASQFHFTVIRSTSIVPVSHIKSDTNRRTLPSLPVSSYRTTTGYYRRSCLPRETRVYSDRQLVIAGYIHALCNGTPGNVRAQSGISTPPRCTSMTAVMLINTARRMTNSRPVSSSAWCRCRIMAVPCGRQDVSGALSGYGVRVLPAP
jgi:hypothetical protein